MKKAVLIILLMLLLPTCVYAEPVNESLTPTVITESANTVNINSGLPEVSKDELTNKANNMVNSIHQMAMDISPQLVIIILVIGAVLGIFLRAARKVIIFALIGLTIIYWAPMLVSLWVQLIQ